MRARHHRAGALGRAAARFLSAAILSVPLHSCQHSASAAAFDGKRAFELLERQCAFGPRVPGTAAHDSCFSFLVDRLRALAPEVACDTFHYDSPDLGKEVRLMNVLARFEPKLKERVLLGAHWDSRPWADRDPDSTRRALPVLGANDGASGVAVLLEVARVLKRTRPAVGVDIALFDGEDLGTGTNPTGYFLGSTRYVEWRGDDRPMFMILVDMVGRKDMALRWERNSTEQAANIVDLIWAEARELRAPGFLSEPGPRVYDDHIPFLNAGIPAVDIIDLAFPEWHTTHDTPAICSPASLESVGRVLVSLTTRASFLSH